MAILSIDVTLKLGYIMNEKEETMNRLEEPQHFEDGWFSEKLVF